MKFIIIVFFFSFCTSYSLNGQIINPGFEDWESDSIFQIPTGWRTDETICISGEYPHVYKDSSSFQGQYSVKITANCYAFEGGVAPTVLTQEFSFDNNFTPSDFSFWIKLLNIQESNGDSIGCASISVYYYYEEGSFSNDSWFISTQEEISEWTKVNIPLNNIDSTKTVDYFIIRIWGGSCAGSLGGIGNSELLVDAAMEFPTSTIILNIDKLRIFPNPTTGIVTLKGIKNHKLDLYTVSGSLIKSVDFSNGLDQVLVNLTDIKENIILAKFTNIQNGNQMIKKIIKIR
jgi:hypothetical protein